MNLLIIGGTQFVGRALAAEALSRGHKVTLFNRGRTNVDLFPEAEKIVGDRDGGLDQLSGRSWDAVIDTCGYVPRLVKESAEVLANSVDRYLFISTISVYDSFREANQAEDSGLATLEDETVEEVNGETYGGLKVLCEQVLEAAMPGRSLIIRPGLITGPHDHTDRFAYWPVRVAQGGKVLVPGRPERPIQHIDARDLAKFSLDLLEQGGTGAYNATGPAEPFTMQELIDTCLAVSGSTAEIYWVDEQFLLDNEVVPWQELPFWIPELNAEMIGLMQVSIQKSLDAGLTFRPQFETIEDVLAWHATREGHEWERTLKPEKEAAVLESWIEKE